MKGNAISSIKGAPFVQLLPAQLKIFYSKANDIGHYSLKTVL
jgi:hypothetical protein